ncbi:MAG: DUF4062 domain-containing protein [Verrucomicrobiaceae bacterium]|nr:DUF4062 domain-containing protein [Verrucomicrobiaceae bacterium]
MHEVAFNRSVFISSTSRGLNSYREQIVEMLRAHDIAAIEQRSFKPEQEDALKLINNAILRATGVICLVGPYFGVPKDKMNEDMSPRLSYTQWECLLAMRLGLKPLIYVLEDAFFEDQGGIQDEAELYPELPDSLYFRKWQNDFRKHLAIDCGRGSIKTPSELWRRLAMINWEKWPTK